MKRRIRQWFDRHYPPIAPIPFAGIVVGAAGMYESSNMLGAILRHAA